MIGDPIPLPRVGSFHNQFDLPAGDMRAVPGYEVVHAVPDRQGQMVGIGPRLLRKINHSEVVLGQIADFRRYIKNSEGAHSFHTSLRGVRIASGDLLQDHRRYEGLELGQGLFPPFRRHVLVSGNDQIAADLGGQVADHGRLDIDGRLHGYRIPKILGGGNAELR
jgi:hypothetical protein